MRVKTSYMNKETKALEAAHANLKPTAAFTFYKGFIYQGGIKYFDPERATPAAKLPPFGAKDRMEMEMEIYDAGLKAEYERYSYQAGITDWSDISSITVINVMDEVLSRKWRKYMLLNAIRSVDMPDLALKIDYISTKMAGQEKVPDLVEATIEEEAFTQLSFDLWKNVVHIAKSDKSQKKANHPIMQIGIEQASKALSKMKNKQIGTELETATGAAGTNWDTMTTAPNNDNNPYTDIYGQVDVIQGLDFDADRIAMDTLVWRAFIKNSFVKEIAGLLKQNPESGDRVALPGLPDVEVVVDTTLTATAAVLYDSTEAFMLGQGPVEAAKYRNEPAGYDAYIIREYLQPLRIDPAASRKLTGLRV